MYPPPDKAPSFREQGERANSGAHAAVKFTLPPSTGLHRALHISPDLPCEEEARAGQRLHALSALPAPRGGAPRVTHSHPRPPPRELGRLLAALLSFLHCRLPTPPLPGPRASPPPPRPPGPGSQRPACAPGALMSSRDSPRWLTWCLVRISRQDLSSGGSISPAHLELPGAAPGEDAERRCRR